MRAKPIPVIAVERWPEVAADIRRAVQPAVIRGAVSGMEQWSPRRFAELYPDLTLPITVDLPKSVPYHERHDRHRATAPVARVIDMIYGGERWYLNQIPVKRFPEFERDLRLEPLFAGVPPEQRSLVSVWIGGLTRSGLHYDHGDNVIVQIHGRKRALLFEPAARRFLYPFADCPNKSQVDPDHVDRRRFPRFERSEAWSCELSVGDALYLPRGWWHHIAATEVSISLNCWHGEMLTRAEHRHLFFTSGPRVILRAVYDFGWHGVLGRPYAMRLNGATPPGLLAYRRLKRRWVKGPVRPDSAAKAAERRR